MSTTQPLHPVIERGMALHKMIRLLSCALAGEGWLTFMGNEWGHPEWIDFPRAGNNDSFQHARRQWNLVDDRLLRYRHLFLWEVGMLHLAKAQPWLCPAVPNFVALKHEVDKVVVADRKEGRKAVVFVFNFHPTQSFTGYRVPVPAAGTWRVVLNSDDVEFGGFSRVDNTVELPSTGEAVYGRADSVLMYLPSRSCMALVHVENDAQMTASAVQRAVEAAK